MTYPEWWSWPSPAPVLYCFDTCRCTQSASCSRHSRPGSWCSPGAPINATGESKQWTQGFLEIQNQKVSKYKVKTTAHHNPLLALQGTFGRFGCRFNWGCLGAERLELFGAGLWVGLVWLGRLQLQWRVLVRLHVICHFPQTCKKQNKQQWSTIPSVNINISSACSYQNLSVGWHIPFVTSPPLFKSANSAARPWPSSPPAGAAPVGASTAGGGGGGGGPPAAGGGGAGAAPLVGEGGAAEVVAASAPCKRMRLL